MEKLLFAIAGAASFAALAADPSTGRTGDISWVGFENYTADQTVVGYGDSGTQGDNSLWSCEGDDASLVKTYGGDNAAAPSIKEPDLFAGETNTKYLALDTNGSELQRAIPAAGQTVLAAGTYIDTLVQFTPSESAPTSTDLDGAKLAIWLGVDSDNNTTNLYVQGNAWDWDADNTAFTLSSQAYALAGKTIEPGTWYRLTVKAIPNVLDSGSGYQISAFQIFVDGTEMTAATAPISAALQSALSDAEISYSSEDVGTAIQANKLIPAIQSALGDASDPVTLSSVGFKGTGAIDDFVVTTVQPDFTPAAIDFTLTLSTDGNVSSVAVTTNGAAVVFENGAAQIPQGATVSIAQPTFATGYQLDSLTTNTVAVAEPSFPFTFTMDEAMTVAITSAALPSYPTYIGEDVALKSQYDAWKAVNGADSTSAYEKQFLLNVASATTVADDALVIESIAENATAGWDIVVSTTVSGAALSDGEATKYNGYLLVKAANDLAGLSSATPVAYPVTAVTGGKVSINVTAGKFMKVVLTTTAPAAQE